jgi:hypothetical protein
VRGVHLADQRGIGNARQGPVLNKMAGLETVVPAQGGSPVRIVPCAGKACAGVAGLWRGIFKRQLRHADRAAGMGSGLRPHSSRMRSEKPLITAGCWMKPGAELTMPKRAPNAKFGRDRRAHV